ncbi:hypothetical protein BU17DRAFT_89508 [Hysterangium stoloniferum]|nr:hypothetical protein BU17DRAFT_89508 [Hysterangium stoloniferum]
MAARSSPRRQSSTTRVDDGVVSDVALPSLKLHVPTATQIYYEAICKLQPQARKNFIVSTLYLYKGPDPLEQDEFVVADIRHRKGYDLHDRLGLLVIEKNPYLSGSYDESASSPNTVHAKHIVSKCTRLCFVTGSAFVDPGHRGLLSGRPITIISKNSHLYSTDVDDSYWFAETIMETAQAISPVRQRDDTPAWLKPFQSEFKLHKPPSECGRQIVAEYRADKTGIPILTPQDKQNHTSSTTSGNEEA